MEALKVVLIVLFVIISVLLILLVLIQNDEGGGMGGLLSGAGSAAFGAHSPSVINKATFVLVALFFITAFSIARINKASVTKDPTVEEAVQQDATSNTDAGDFWNELENSSSSANQEVLTVPEAQ